MGRKRADVLCPALFADPCWDMLLDLYVQSIAGTPVSVTSACLASGVPCTTALGHVRRLERRRLIVREADGCDGRRSHLQLTASTADAIRKWINATFCDTISKAEQRYIVSLPRSRHSSKKAS